MTLIFHRDFSFTRLCFDRSPWTVQEDIVFIFKRTRGGTSDKIHGVGCEHEWSTELSRFCVLCLSSSVTMKLVIVSPCKRNRFTGVWRGLGPVQVHSVVGMTDAGSLSRSGTGFVSLSRATFYALSQVGFRPYFRRYYSYRCASHRTRCLFACADSHASASWRRSPSLGLPRHYHQV